MLVNKLYKSSLLLVAMLFCVFSGFAQLDPQGNAYMKNDYIQAALGPYGCYGSSSNSTVPTGYYTPANAGSNGKLGFICSPEKNWPFYYGDFMLPGDPYEAFSVTFTNSSTNAKTTRINTRSSGPSYGVILPKSPAFTYHGSGYSEVTWHGQYAGEFDIDCHFKLDGPRIIHRTTIKNTSSVKYTNVYFVRAMDPDQENGANSSGIPPGCSATAATYNVIQSQANGTPGKVAWVTANGYCAPSSISYYCENPDSRVGISNPWRKMLANPTLAWGTSASGLYLAEEEYSRTAAYDWSIELAIFVGDLNPGESKTIEHEIRLDQPPVVKFSTDGLDANNTLTKNEGETFTYKVLRDYQLAETVTVGVTLSSVTGASAADFDGVDVLPKTYTLVFGPDEKEKTISVTAAYDAVSDDNEKFQFEITSVTSSVGGLATMPSKVYGIIKDVPLPVATIGGCTTVNEGSNCTLTVNLSKSPIAEVGPSVLDLDFAGTATFGTGNDYTITPLTNMTHVSGSIYRITIPVGQTTATFRLNALTDNVYEPGNETVIPTLTPVSGVISIIPTTTVTIVDKTIAPVIKIDPINTISANEGSVMTFALELVGSTCSKNVTVVCGTANNTAVAPGDYIAKSETVTFSPGQISQTFTVQTNADKLIEGDEYFYVNLSSATNATIHTAQTNGKIEDITDGTIVVVKQTPTGDAKENPLTHGSFRIKFKDDEVKTSPDRKVKVVYNLLGSTSVSAQDHTISPSPGGEATIPANSNYVDVIVNVINNYIVQGDHDVKITITSATPQ